MYKLLNLIFIIIILVFSWSIYKYYFSHKNYETKNYNRNNINEIINDKISDLPILDNDTNNVIEFNNSLLDGTKSEKPRSFWQLLKSK